MSKTAASVDFPLVLYGIPCREIGGSGRRSYSLKDSKRYRILECAWDRCDELARCLIGFTAPFLIVLPDFVPDNPSIVCTDVAIEGQGAYDMDDRGQIRYKWARLHCTYSSPDFKDVTTSVVADPITNKVETKLSESFHAGGELMKAGKGKYKWAKSGKDLDQDIVMFQGFEEINITMYKIKKVDRFLIDAARNCVNRGAFRGYSQGHVLCMGGDSQLNTNTDGTKSANVTMKFLQRDQDWNYQFNPESNAWEEVVPHIYDMADFDKILAMGK